MVTVRTYFNLIQAHLEKSLLDDYEIFCDLWDENAHYIPAVFAIPVRLVVADGQAEAAILALRNDLDPLAEYLEPVSEEEPTSAEIAQSLKQAAAENRNPWELLAVAYYFFAPALCFLQIRYPKFVEASGFRGYLIAKVTIAHFLGWVAVAVAMLLVVTYFHMRRVSKAMDVA
jgi:hypothetical protein